MRVPSSKSSAVLSSKPISTQGKDADQSIDKGLTFLTRLTALPPHHAQHQRALGTPALTMDRDHVWAAEQFRPEEGAK